MFFLLFQWFSMSELVINTAILRGYLTIRLSKLRIYFLKISSTFHEFLLKLYSTSEYFKSLNHLDFVLFRITTCFGYLLAVILDTTITVILLELLSMPPKTFILFKALLLGRHLKINVVSSAFKILSGVQSSKIFFITSFFPLITIRTHLHFLRISHIPWHIKVHIRDFFFNLSNQPLLALNSSRTKDFVHLTAFP